MKNEEYVNLYEDKAQNMDEDEIDERIDIQYLHQTPQTMLPSLQNPELLNYINQLLRVRFIHAKNLEDWMFKENMNHQ